MEGTRQRQAAHVAHEDPPARPQRRGRALQHAQQVAQVREVLRDRVEDDRVELRPRELRQLVRLALRQGHLREPRGMPADVLQRHPREVGPVVGPRVRRHAEEQQPRPAPDLQHPLRTQRQDALRRVLDPRAHLLARDRLARVAAVPPLQRQGRVFFPLVLRVGVVEERFPLGHLLRAAAGGLDAVRARDDVGDQAPVPGRVLPRQHDGLPHAGLLAQHGLHLAGLDAEAAHLDLLVGAPQELQHAVRAPAGAVAGAVGPLRPGADELLGVQLRPAQVAPCDPSARDPHLAGHARAAPSRRAGRARPGARPAAAARAGARRPHPPRARHTSRR